MRKFSLFLTLMLLLAASSSCDEEIIENGAYYPERKIIKMYENSWSGGEKMLFAVWNWDGDKLKTIDYYNYKGEIDYTEYYIYNEDGRIGFVNCPELEEMIKYEYDGNKLSKAFYYEKGSMETEYDFVYEGNKISEIGYTMSENDVKKDSKRMSFDPVSIILPKHDLVKIEKMARKNNLRKDEEIRIPIKLEWNEDNISKMSVEITFENIKAGMSMEYKYDGMINPFMNILTLYPEETLNFECSKNNVTEIITTEFIGNEEENMSNSYTTFISYTYNGKYPLTMDVDGEIIYFEYE